MNILGIESSAVSAGAAVVSEGKLISESFLNRGLTHSQTLMPLVDAALKNAGMTVEDIDLIAVSAGPGSFTGLRIGVGTAKGLAMPGEKLTAAVSTLLGLAYNLPDVKGIIAPIMDARRGEVYNALYKWENNKLTELVPMRALPVTELAKELSESGAIFVGDGADVHRQTLTDLLGEKAEFAPAHLMYQRAASVAMAAEGIAGIPADDLLPIYIRKPQAERELEERENKK